MALRVNVRRLDRWIAAAVVGCVALAVAYLPPRGTARRAQQIAAWQAAKPTAEATRAAELTDAWRRADLALQLAQERRVLAPALDRLRNVDGRTVILTIEGPVDSAQRAYFAARLDTMWQQLGLGTTKIGVGTILTVTADTAGTPHPRRVPPFSPSYYFPDSLDRHTCLSIVALGRGQVSTFRMRDRDGILRRSLGPCAFYAAFGKPSPAIERWLAARHYDVALDASWVRRGPRAARAGDNFLDFETIAPEQRRWMWRWLYQAPPATVGCIGGQQEACLNYVMAGARSPEAAGAPSAVASTDFERHGQPLPGATELLSSMLRDFGAARFARFWTSPHRVDTAFAQAMDTSLARWVTDRQGTLTPVLPLGPAAPLSASLLGLLLGFAAVGGAALVATRRQIG